MANISDESILDLEFELLRSKKQVKILDLEYQIMQTKNQLLQAEIILEYEYLNQVLISNNQLLESNNQLLESQNQLLLHKYEKLVNQSISIYDQQVQCLQYQFLFGWMVIRNIIEILGLLCAVIMFIRLIIYIVRQIASVAKKWFSKYQMRYLEWLHKIVQNMAIYTEKKSVEYGCNQQNISHCDTLIQFRKTVCISDQYLAKQKVNSASLDYLNVGHILDDYLHLMKYHDDDVQLPYCGIETCAAFERNYRDRNRRCMPQEHLDVTQRIKLEILDKVHCNFQHTFDIGNRLRANENINICIDANKVKEQNESWKEYMTNKAVTEVYNLLHKKKDSLGIAGKLSLRMNRYNNLAQDQHVIINMEEMKEVVSDELKNEDKALYNLGYLFEYASSCVNCTNVKNTVLRRKIITILPMHCNLREELTQHERCRITMEQYKHELLKAQLYKQSRYCRSNFELTFQLHHILSVMVHCNYDGLQNEFNKTYRMNQGRDHRKFYFWGKYLTEAVKKHGTRMCDENIKQLYHGISEPLLINLFLPNMHGLTIGCPLSTTTCFEVACQFTNHNKGLIFQFSDGSSQNHTNSPKYFSCAWLSDFPSEREYLFIQNEPSTDSLIVHNIINAKSGMEYHHIIYALYMRCMWLFDVKPHKGSNWTELFKNKNWKTTISMIKNEIWQMNFGGRHCFTDEYAIKLIKAYINNETGIRLKINRFAKKIDFSLKYYVGRKWEYGATFGCFASK
eukprot:3156_1